MAIQIEDRRRVTIRLSVLQYVITVIFSVLAVSFWVLQVVQHAKFEEMAENNHQRTLALRAPRGLVLDRNGKILVDNRGSYSISIDRERTKDLNRTIRLLAAVHGLRSIPASISFASGQRMAAAPGARRATLASSWTRLASARARSRTSSSRDGPPRETRTFQRRR